MNILWWDIEFVSVSNLFFTSISCLSPFLLSSLPLLLPLYMSSCSESVLELSIMPKDEDVLQLVSVSMGFFTHLIPPPPKHQAPLMNCTHYLRTLQEMVFSACKSSTMIHPVIVMECRNLVS